MCIQGTLVTQIIYIMLCFWYIIFFEECSKFRSFNIQNFTRNIENELYSTNTIIQRIYIILYIQSTQFFKKKYKILHVQQTKIFTEYLKFYVFNEHNYSNNLLNFIHSKYTISWRSYTILYFNVHIFK